MPAHWAQLLTRLVDGDLRAAQLSLDLLRAVHSPLAKTRSSPPRDFGDFMRAKGIDFAVLDGLLDDFASRPSAAPAASAETETCPLCLWTPDILSVEPRTISIPHPLDADLVDKVQQVRICGWGWSEKEKEKALAEVRAEEASLWARGASAVKVFANDRPCDDVRVLSDHVIVAALPSRLSSGPLRLVVEVLVEFSHPRGGKRTLSSRSDGRFPSNRLEWISVKMEKCRLSTPSAVAQGMQLLSPPSSSSGRRGRKLTRKTRKSARRPASQSSSNADNSAMAMVDSELDCEAEAVFPDGVVESQSDEAANLIHSIMDGAVEEGMEELAEISFIRKGNKRLQHCGVALTACLNSSDTEDTEVEYDNTPLPQTRRRKNIVVDSDDEEEEESRTPPRPLEAPDGGGEGGGGGEGEEGVEGVIGEVARHIQQRMLSTLRRLCSSTLLQRHPDEVDLHLDMDTISQSVEEGLYKVFLQASIPFFDLKALVADVRRAIHGRGLEGDALKASTAASYLFEKALRDCLSHRAMEKDWQRVYSYCVDGDRQEEEEEEGGSASDVSRAICVSLLQEERIEIPPDHELIANLAQLDEQSRERLTRFCSSAGDLSDLTWCALRDAMGEESAGPARDLSPPWSVSDPAEELLQGAAARSVRWMVLDKGKGKGAEEEEEDRAGMELEALSALLDTFSAADAMSSASLRLMQCLDGGGQASSREMAVSASLDGERIGQEGHSLRLAAGAAYAGRMRLCAGLSRSTRWEVIQMREPWREEPTERPVEETAAESSLSSSPFLRSERKRLEFHRLVCKAMETICSSSTISAGSSFAPLYLQDSKGEASPIAPLPRQLAEDLVPMLLKMCGEEMESHRRRQVSRLQRLEQSGGPVPLLEEGHRGSLRISTRRRAQLQARRDEEGEGEREEELDMDLLDAPLRRMSKVTGLAEKELCSLVESMRIYSLRCSYS